MSRAALIFPDPTRPTTYVCRCGHSSLSAARTCLASLKRQHALLHPDAPRLRGRPSRPGERLPDYLPRPEDLGLTPNPHRFANKENQ